MPIKNMFNKISCFSWRVVKVVQLAFVIIGFGAGTVVMALPAQASITASASTSDFRTKTQIAVSNYPLFLLSEAVTKGAPSGKVLLEAGDVGHHGGLSPKDMQTISNSRYVVWFGKSLESNLAKPLASHSHTIALFDLNAFRRLALRDVKGQAIKGTLDPHIWLDPENAKAITRALGAIYSRANPKYKDVYTKNVQKFAQEMDKAVAEVSKKQHSNDHLYSYWAYHDAFQYIERALNLKMVGAVTADHHLPPKASQLYWLKKNRPQQTMCLLLQSDNNLRVIDKLQSVRTTTQQEDMSQATSFVNGWLALAKDITQCVLPQS